MEEIFQDSGRVAWAGHLHRPYEFVSPCGGREFSMLLMVADDSITQEEQVALSREFVRQGCRYAVCAGHGCSSWDDSIDWAFLETDPGYSPPDDKFVMTSWHDDEPMDDIANFLVMCTSFDAYEATAFVVVCLGGDAEAYREIRNAVWKRLRSGTSASSGYRFLLPVLVGPLVVVLATVLLRVALHHGAWRAFDAFDAALLLAVCVAGITSAALASRARQGRRTILFMGSFVGQLLLGLALLNLVWWLLPLGFSGP